MLTGAVQERSIRDGPLAVAASPVGAPGAVREMSLTLTSVPAVQERPVERCVSERQKSGFWKALTE